MQHLDAARLAAFDHDPFTPDELAHLAGCAACRAERDAVAQLVTYAGGVVTQDIASDAPRLVAWDSLARSLRDEGLLTTGEHAAPDAARDAAEPPPIARRDRQVVPRHVETPVSGQRWFQRVRQVAAALALVAGGAVMGRLSTGAETATGPVAQAGAMARAVGFGDTGFASVEQATQVLNQAQRDYERASVWLASNDPTIRDSDVYRARLAALDQMMAASRAALREAPQDPVLNHYYLSAYSAREATLQALSGALPVDKVIERY
ncbi:MAG: hypothetical protein K2R93_11310 [Gemmatimonadaceae bacterium]|nr:hypothetical protein [Gemmatimonadaceae bacterium]